MKLIYENKTLVLLGIAGIALVGIISFSFYSSIRIKSSSTKVEHTQEVLRKIENVFLDMLNIETGTRGFLLTANKTFLEPYYLSSTTINKNIGELKRLTSDNSSQQRKIATLNLAIDERLIFTEKTIIEKSNGELTDDRLLATNLKGKELTDNIRNIISDIENDEFILLHQRKKMSEKSQKYSDVTFVFLLVLVLIILFLVYIINENQKGKNRISTELSESNLLLQKSLKEASAYKFALQESYIVAITDARGIIKFANKNFSKISGYTVEELIGQDHRILNSSYHPKFFFEEMFNTILSGKIWRGEIRNKTKTGTMYWVDSTIVPFRNEENKVFQFVSIRIDITDRKNAQAQLEELNKELESFTYSISHDLRAPLRAINGYAKIIQEDYSQKLDEDGCNSLNSILNNSRKMGELIDDLLAFSRLGKKELSKSEINMKVLVKSVIDDEKLGHALNMNFVVDELHSVFGQQVLIKQVWVNLISNAVKYSRNTLQTEIHIGSYFMDNTIVFFVKDNGAGFDMQYYNKLFGVFQRLHSAEEFEGTGIGLAIVKKVITRHKGNVWAESELNKGATFYFSLPTINSKI